MYLSADNLTNLMWWVDGSYGVHWDSKGHTRAMMSMGKGTIVNVSRRHKLNVATSTESELVSIADVLGVMIWRKYFMEAHKVILSVWGQLIYIFLFSFFMPDLACYQKLYG